MESGHASPSRFGTRALSKVNDAPGPDDPNALLIALDDGRTSAIMDLTGTRLALGLDCAPNTSLLFPHACVPTLVAELKAGTTLLVTGVRALENGAGEAAAAPPTVDAVRRLAQLAGWPEVNAVQLTSTPKWQSHTLARID